MNKGMVPSRRSKLAAAKPADARGRLLAAAAAELVRGGGVFEVAAVAERAGLSVGLGYHYFGSKAGLVAAVVEDFYDRYDAAVIDINPHPGADWAERERRRLDWIIDFMYREPLAPIILARLGGEPEVAAVEARRLGRHVRIGAGNIALGQQQGLIPKDIDPGLLVAMIMGGLRQALGDALGRAPRPDPKWLARQLWASIAAAARLPSSR